MVQHQLLDQQFAALSDPTRRAILERLGRGDASISELAQPLAITLTGVKKHVQVLEDAGLVITRKVGRVRMCSLEPRQLEEVVTWIAGYRQTVADRFDRFAELLEREKETDR